MIQEALWTPDDTESLGRCWGIDPGTAWMALGIHDGVRYGASSCHLPRAADPLRRLSAALPAMCEFLERAVHVYGRPSVVCIEQPAGVGHNVHPATWYITGATGMAVVQTVDCPVHLVGPPTWKSEAMGKGHGHSTKEQVRAWVHARGWRGSSEHEADAAVIARCAYVRLAKHLSVGGVS